MRREWVNLVADRRKAIISLMCGIEIESFGWNDDDGDDVDVI